uniref:Uncharacterized protein n=1 Tax=viral metagenome TaxID=1070528 RepID=A0A6M3K5Y7_9ZZZZ
MTECIAKSVYTDTLKRWVVELESRYGRGQKALWDINEADDMIGVRLYTDGHVYSIKATPVFLGCTASTRKARPGEDWTRGNDLADGEFNEETWLKILKDIVSYELKSISNYVLKMNNGFIPETCCESKET